MAEIPKNDRWIPMQKKVKKTFFLIVLVLGVYLAVPVAITLSLTGVIEENVSDELINGRRVVVKYQNASKSTDINKFIIMVLAGRFSLSSQIEVLKAESVMIRTDIYRIMGDRMSIDSKELGMSYMTERQMKNAWGDKYEENYNLIADCVAATSGRLMRCNGTLIEARYTAVSSGKTLSGGELLGDNYAYLAAVDCPDDVNSPDYLTVHTISYKDFVKKMKAQYTDIGLNENNPLADIQIVLKSDSGYVVKLQVGNVVMTGAKFAEILEINSACMNIENLNGSLKITTKGKGDGFGVSLYTADIMAQNGSSYEEILQKFYSGISFVSE